MSNAASALRAFPTVCPNYLRADLVRTLSCSSRVIAARALYMKAWGNPKNILQSGSIISSEYLYLPLDSVRAQTTVPLVRLRPRSGGGSAPARIQQHFAYLQTQNPKTYVVVVALVGKLAFVRSTRSFLTRPEEKLAGAHAAQTAGTH